MDERKSGGLVLVPRRNTIRSSFVWQKDRTSTRDKHQAPTSTQPRPLSLLGRKRPSHSPIRSANIIRSLRPFDYTIRSSKFTRQQAPLRSVPAELFASTTPTSLPLFMMYTQSYPSYVVLVCMDAILSMSGSGRTLVSILKKGTNDARTDVCL